MGDSSNRKRHCSGMWPRSRHSRGSSPVLPGRARGICDRGRRRCMGLTLIAPSSTAVAYIALTGAMIALMVLGRRPASSRWPMKARTSGGSISSKRRPRKWGSPIVRCRGGRCAGPLGQAARRTAAVAVEPPPRVVLERLPRAGRALARVAAPLRLSRRGQGRERLHRLPSAVAPDDDVGAIAAPARAVPLVAAIELGVEVLVSLATSFPFAAYGAGAMSIESAACIARDFGRSNFSGAETPGRTLCPAPVGRPARVPAKASTPEKPLSHQADQPSRPLRRLM